MPNSNTNSNTNSVRKVFITNMGDKDFSALKSFGELIYLTDGFVPFNDITKLVERVERKLDVAKEDDYLVLSGSNLLCTMLVMIWLNKFGKATILNYDTRNGYRPVEVNFKDFFVLR